jgi:hypothetical protein
LENGGETETGDDVDQGRVKGATGEAETDEADINHGKSIRRARREDCCAKRGEDSTRSVPGIYALVES